ncbi:ERF family protein [Moorena sp. SIO3H5]|uniref:ERF family protein n=1 Tax=Moorena sp. SIO3H5 TaxID=2607834 RepID=UPI0013B64337|nr:ERF family protein [Moorena sp. SIO3H5]NEO72150.1 hypothetical protein [Moorena sp. SIO3H5]
MKDCKNIEKDATVGTGQNQYKSVSDKLVKEKLQPLLVEHGLCVIPKSIETDIRVDRWEHTYQGKPAGWKQQIFTEAKCSYTLMHVSGESIDFAGYGHGVDPQDKSAGKSTTYALKKALLYLFMIPTGDLNNLDDPEELDIPQVPSWFDQAVEYLVNGGSMDQIVKDKKIGPDVQKKLQEAVDLLT